MLFSFALVQVGTEVACFQQDPKLWMHIRQLGKKILLRYDIFTEAFCQYELLSTWYGFLQISVVDVIVISNNIPFIRYSLLLEPYIFQGGISLTKFVST